MKLSPERLRNLVGGEGKWKVSGWKDREESPRSEI